jgi:serine/threonine-protein kinase/endoribonuclease IRE1
MQELQSIELDERYLIGHGGSGKVFFGRFEGKKVAVKRVDLMDTDEREEEALKKLNHLNVVKLYHVESHKVFK